MIAASLPDVEMGVNKRVEMIIDEIEFYCQHKDARIKFRKMLIFKTVMLLATKRRI